MSATTRPNVRCDRGTALIETALTLPLVLLLSISVFEFGRAFQHWQVLTNAAREGARLATLPGKSDDDVTARVRAYIDAGQLSAGEYASVDIDRDDAIAIGGGATAPASTVSVNYPFEFVALQPLMKLIVSSTTVGDAITITSSATMRNE
jgi:Flp pilus assembly protein TadG